MDKAITVIWDNEEHTILRYVFEGPWKWNDFQQATKDAAELLDTVNYPVGVIIDLLHSHSVPDQPLANIKNALSNPRHSNVGLTVVVGANMFLTALADSARKIYRRVSGNYDINLVSSLDEARKILSNAPKLGPSTPSDASAGTPATSAPAEGTAPTAATTDAEAGQANVGSKHE